MIGMPTRLVKTGVYVFLKPEYEKFLVIYEEQSLSRAADRLDTYQGALSKVLSRLEHEVGESLFVRGHRGLVATPFGNHLYTQLQQQVGLWKNFNQKIKNLKEEPQGEYRVGGHEIVLSQFSHAFSNIIEKYPKVNFSFELARSPVATRMVLNHQLDFAIVADASPFDELVIIDLKKESVAMYAQSEKVKNDAIYINPDLIYTQMLVKVQKKKKLIPVPDYGMCCEMAKSCGAVAVAPESVAMRHGLTKKISDTLFLANISLVVRSDYKSHPGLNGILNEIRKFKS
jgi:DNA-binding transcriptional LysR family regulator